MGEKNVRIGIRKSMISTVERAEGIFRFAEFTFSVRLSMEEKM